MPSLHKKKGPFIQELQGKCESNQQNTAEAN